MENILLLSLVVTVALSFLPHYRFGLWAFRFAVIVLLISLIDTLLGNWRWQIIPAYVFAFIMPIVTYYRSRILAPSIQKRNFIFGGYLLLSTLLLFIAVVLPKQYPMFDLPAPSGPYHVGIRDIHLVDESRSENMTTELNDHRELMVTVWYPADAQKGMEPEPFLRDRNIEPLHFLMSKWGLPTVTVSHLTKIPSHSHLNATVATGASGFPVLVFNHGNMFYASQNSLLMETLASHGYIIFSIDHPYQAAAVKFPDGDVIKYVNDWYDNNITSERTDEEMQRVVQQIARQFSLILGANSYSEYFQHFSEFHENMSGLNAGLQRWLDDTEFLLDQLDSRKNGISDLLGDKLDLDRIGIFGMSYGGAMAGMFCAKDSRCKAGLNMDGVQYGLNATDIQLRVPFMMMNADSRRMLHSIDQRHDLSEHTPFQMNDFLYHQSESVFYSFVVEGSNHGLFSDFGLIMKPPIWVSSQDVIDPWTMKRILDDYTLAFFNKHLKGRQESLLDASSERHPEVGKFVVKTAFQQENTTALNDLD